MYVIMYAVVLVMTSPDLCWISTTIGRSQPASSVVFGDFPTVSTDLQLFKSASNFR